MTTEMTANAVNTAANTVNPVNTANAVNTAANTANAVTHSWRDALPLDLREHEFVKNFEKPGDLVKSYIELKNGLPKVPETPEGYDFVDKDIPIAKEYQEISHKVRLTPEQSKTLYEWYNSKVKELETNESKLLDELKKEWRGETFEKNQLIAQNAFKRVADEEAISFLEHTTVNGVKLGNHPSFLKMFKRIGDLISEDTALSREHKNQRVMTDADFAKIMFPSMNKGGF